MRRNAWIVVTTALCLVGILALTNVFNPPPKPRDTATAPANIATTRKKLIEYGWDVPMPDFLPTNIAALEQKPFDGMVVKLNVGPIIFTHAPFAELRFEKDRENLKATTFKRFTDNFLIVWSSSDQGWNFQSDSDWASA